MEFCRQRLHLERVAGGHYNPNNRLQCWGGLERELTQGCSWEATANRIVSKETAMECFFPTIHVPLYTIEDCFEWIPWHKFVSIVQKQLFLIFLFPCQTTSFHAWETFNNHLISICWGRNCWAAQLQNPLLEFLTKQVHIDMDARSSGAHFFILHWAHRKLN